MTRKTALLCLVLALCALPCAALADSTFTEETLSGAARYDDWAYRTEDGQVTLNYYLDGRGELGVFEKDVTLFIPAKIDGKPVAALSEYCLDFITGRVAFEVEEGSEAFVKRGPLLLSADEKTLFACDRDYRGALTVPDGVETIYHSALRNCDWLTSVELPEGLTWIGNWALEGCAQLSELTLPQTIEKLGFGALARCSGLSEIEVPQGIDELYERTFYGCMGLERVVLPEGLLEIGPETFMDCVSLSEVHLPAGLLTIAEQAFYGCTSLAAIELPVSLKRIAEFAFYHCTALLSVSMPGDVSDIEELAFADCAPNLVFKAPSGGNAYRYALENGIGFAVVGAQ